MNIVYILAANCKITSGVQRSLLIDLQSERLFFISNKIQSLLSTPIRLELVTDNEERQIINELISLSILLPVPEDELDHFPTLSNDYEFPAQIVDVILEIEETNYFETIFVEMEQLCCNHIEVRLFGADPVAVEGIIANICEVTKTSTIETIEFHLRHSVYRQCAEGISGLYRKYGRLDRIVVYESPIEEVPSQVVVFHPGLLDARNCGSISKTYFSVNFGVYLESLKHNTCLHRKLSIDSKGNVKNCPSLPETFGNIYKNRLSDIVASSAFSRVGHIRKDDIEVCKLCEFRNVCSDCRAYLQSPSNLLSKPLKCGYDPQTCSWEDWRAVPENITAITHYKLESIL